MRAVDIIIEKRDGGALSREAIQFFIDGYVSGEILDYQMAALAMAILLNGMSDEETADLTLAMAHSGEMLDLSPAVKFAVDKHSTGGVGDKTTLVVGPAVAACGLPVGKMSGRGLGFSGGTLDKLESIPGFRANLTTEEFLSQLRRIGIVVTGQSAELAPADGKLYALRDVTGTVPCIPLIASSVMSKKIAAGAQAILLDVKFGNGAFMETLEEARKLGTLMVEIGRRVGRQTVALLSDMNQPLGCAVGNALELVEAIQTLKNEGPADFVEHCLEVGGHMLVLGKITAEHAQARGMIGQAIANGDAYEKFCQFVAAQGGDLAYVNEPSQLPTAKLQVDVPAPRSGYLSQVKASSIGEAAVHLGGGRAKKGDPIDYAVGVIVHHKVGDSIQTGQPLFTIHANDQGLLESAREAILAAHEWNDTPVEPLPLFYGIIR